MRLFKKEPSKIASINRPTTTSKAESSADGFIMPKSAKELLSGHRREVILDRIWEQTSVSRESFTRLYQAPIARYAELVK